MVLSALTLQIEAQWYYPVMPHAHDSNTSSCASKGSSSDFMVSFIISAKIQWKIQNPSFLRFGLLKRMRQPRKKREI